MAFASNPLALSVPEVAFESWLRDSGYLEILDQRTSDLHRLTSDSSSTGNDHLDATTASTASATAIAVGFLRSTSSCLATIFSLFTLNPFAKLTTDDFSGETPSWTLEFIGCCGSYSLPSSPSQARLRVHENVKRYARNYASLFILAFACSLYQMPLALVGLISSLALWDLFWFCGNRWGLDRYPAVRQSLLRIAQCDGSVLRPRSQLCSYGFACLISEADSYKATCSGEMEILEIQQQRKFGQVWFKGCILCTSY